MKKVILLLSTVAILGFVSCMKQSPDFGPDELEIVFEELEGTETKAALTEINLDKYGSFVPSSQLLTAKLQYKATKQKVSGEIDYVWDVKCAAVDENPDPWEKSKNTLIATNYGTGSVSVSATYKGQEVQSSSIPIKVTANEIIGLRFDVDCRRLGETDAFYESTGNNSTYPIPGKWHCSLSTSYKPYNMYYNLYLDYKENGTTTKSLDLTNSSEATVTIPDFPSAQFDYNKPTDVYGLNTNYKKAVVLHEDPTYNGTYFGKHAMHAEYKNYSVDYDFDIKSDLNEQDFYVRITSDFTSPFKSNGEWTIYNGQSAECEVSKATYLYVNGAFDKSLWPDSQGREYYDGIPFSELHKTGIATIVLEQGSTQTIIPYAVGGLHLSKDLSGQSKIKLYYFNELIFSCNVKWY